MSVQLEPDQGIPRFHAIEASFQQCETSSARQASVPSLDFRHETSVNLSIDAPCPEEKNSGVLPVSLQGATRPPSSPFEKNAGLGQLCFV